MQVSAKEDSIFLKGKLTVDTVVQTLSQTKPLISYDTSLTIHFEHIENCDSAGLAFVTAILREAKRKRTNLSFANVPQQMLDLSRVSGLDRLLTTVT